MTQPNGLTPNVGHILHVLQYATASQLNEGRAWYPTTHDFARSLSHDVDQAAGVIAALSPITPWKRNKELALLAFNGGLTGGTLTGSIEKVNRMLDGEHPESVLATAKKTLNFYRNISNPTGDFVTVDRHAFSVAIGRQCTDKEYRIINRKGMYQRFSDCYREAARRYNMNVSTMQAITWVVWENNAKI